MGEQGRRVSAAGEPTAVTPFAHVGPLGTVGQHLVVLRAAQTIPAMTGQAFILNQRLFRLGLRRLDEQPRFSSAAWPIARRRLSAVARGEEPGCNFASWWRGSVGGFHSYAVVCLYGVTLRRCAAISSPNLSAI